MSRDETPSWNVWLVSDVYPPGCGGSGWSTHALARTLTDRGHRVQVFAVDATRKDVGHRSYQGIEVTTVGVLAARRRPSKRLGARDYAYGDLVAYLSQRYQHEADVDIVHAQHLHSGPPAVAFGRAHGLATVVTVRDYWPVCLHGTSWWGAGVCAGCTITDLTGCMTDTWNWPRPLSRLMVPWARRRLRARAQGLAAAHKVIAVSHAVKRRIETEIPNLDFSVVPNVVDPEHVETAARQRPGSPTPGSYLLATGKLQPTKGFDRLLAALAEVGSRRPLLIAGDGPSRGALESQAAALGLPTTFLGWVEHDELLGLQRDAHAVVLPSAWHEPLSRVVLETMGLGTPIIAWDSGGTSEMIEHGSHGFLVKAPADLRESLAALESEETRQHIGTAARARIREQFCPDAVYPTMVATYAAAIEKADR